jgi:hypothetical protein
MTQVHLRNLRCLPLVLATLACGCGSMGGDTAAQASVAPPTPSVERPVIEESDIYRQEGSILFVQNAQTGLNLLDISTPSKPQLLGRASATAGSAGELYVRKDQAIVLLKQATASCRNPTSRSTDTWLPGMEVAIIDATRPAQPQLTDRYCIPGEYVASRLVGSILYLITSDGSTTSRAISLDLTEPREARVVQVMELGNAGKEILVTTSAIFIAAYDGTSSWERSTSVQMISIRSDGVMLPRGKISVPGEPQGRFHMDLAGAQFRIVTFETTCRQSRLSIIDVSDLDAPRLIGSLGGIGSGEKLYATRFDGDRVYVVTFRQTDPLWVISLRDPTAPVIVGELRVPGWSDFLFPRGNRLIAVGRGDRGSSLAVSLFDVTNPAAPRSLHQITLGDPSGASEANVDFRAVTILEQPGQPPLILVPHTLLSYGYRSSCQPGDYVELVEVMDNTSLQARARVSQKGTIRRTLLVGSQLYSISDYEVLSVDIANRVQPVVSASVTVGSTLTQNATYSSYCANNYGQDSWGYDGYEGHGHFICSLPASGRVGSSWPPPVVVLGLIWFVRFVIRSGRRRFH